MAVVSNTPNGTNGHNNNGHGNSGYSTNGHSTNGYGTNGTNGSSKEQKAAFITGITGQDGSYLTEILLSEGYIVHGLVRPSSQRRQALERPMRHGVTLHLGDVCDSARLIQILGSIKVDEIYHLAAQSHVGISFENPLATCDTNAVGTLKLLEAVRFLGLGKTIRIYNACSSELFGPDTPPPQTEETPFHPYSPYAVSKAFQFWTTVNFREAYGFHASNGILFNHESPRRGTTFVTRKITTQVALIATGQSELFELGNVNSTRDWGHSKDYMRGAYLILQQPEGGDYVLATGSSYSVRDFVNAAFDVVGMKIEWSGKGLDEVAKEVATGKVRVRVNPAFYRQLDVENLSGSAAKARRVLGWEPQYNFQTLVEEMVLSDLEKAKAGRIFATSYLDGLVEDDTGIEGVNRQEAKATNQLTFPVVVADMAQALQATAD
ncbi:hypothetical protein VHEMI08246 [[Torrubiella] hemipterigena]|uniref:GDP-mannose 4,6-dehydratase n=1 Tax=[Torrubiella] hemipterigena TaxID=1531966 RepID=A0A0A1TMV0_9HYPO|nr:hypothetical protein VHEMI08246 [[Torrubiella] hemipterigena]